MRLTTFPLITNACTAAVLIVGCAAQAELDDVSPISRLPLVSATFADLGESRPFFRVFDVEIGRTIGDLRFVTSHGVFWTNGQGELTRHVGFRDSPGPLFHACSLQSGTEESYAAFDSDRRQLRFFDPDGTEVAHVPTPSYPIMTVADLEGTGQQSLIVLAGGGASVTIFDRRGDRRSTFPTTGYARAVAVGRVPGQKEESLFIYASPDPELGEGVRVFGSDGKERRKWRVQAQGAIATTMTADGTALVTTISDDNSLTDWEPQTGKVRGKTLIKGSSAFREIHSAYWGTGFRVVVLSGPAGLPKHMVAVVDREGAVAFQRISEGRANALALSSRYPGGFLVGVEGRVVRYSLP